MNSNDYPKSIILSKPCHIKLIINNYDTDSFSQNSLLNAHASSMHQPLQPSLHRAPALCFLVNILLFGDYSGGVAPSSSLEISQGLGWALFLSFVSWLSLVVPLSPLC